MLLFAFLFFLPFCVRGYEVLVGKDMPAWLVFIAVVGSYGCLFFEFFVCVLLLPLF
jgi:hypothetical protein